MKVLHINQSDVIGGSGIAGYRLHQGLLQEKIDSRMLVGRRKISDKRTATIPRMPRVENKIVRLTKPLGLNYLEYVGAMKIIKHPFYKEANIINFHNLHSGKFNYLVVPLLTKNKPAVFTLHDMWSFTGHCAYSYDCERWKTGCGKCPYPDAPPLPIKRDNTYIEWKLKKLLYRFSDLTIVGDSKWLTDLAKQSMLNRFPIHHIPYGLNTKIYKPLDPQECKSRLNIDTQKKVLMFGAVNLKVRRKGGDLLIKALANLPKSLKSEIVLLVFGDSGKEITQAVDLEVVDLGYVSDHHSKAVAYSAADLFLFPTRADAFGMVAMEAAACGTPTVSFDVGGVSDIVRPGLTGYLAKPEDIDDFCQGIIKLLEDNNLRQQISKSCRSIVLQEYTLELQAKRYIQLYRQILTGMKL